MGADISSVISFVGLCILCSRRYISLCFSCCRSNCRNILCGNSPEALLITSLGAISWRLLTVMETIQRMWGMIIRAHPILHLDVSISTSPRL